MWFAGAQEPAAEAGMKGGEQGQRGAAAVSEGARALIRRCLSVDQRLRPTAAELLADPWLALKDGTGGGGSLGAGAPFPLPRRKGCRLLRHPLSWPRVRCR